MPVRLYMLLRPGSSTPGRHYLGLPHELGGASQQRLPWPGILLIESVAEGHFLYRYTDAGEFAGDTFHLTLEEAQEAAADEYGQALSQWLEVPADAGDGLEYALARRADQAGD